MPSIRREYESLWWAQKPGRLTTREGLPVQGLLAVGVGVLLYNQRYYLERLVPLYAGGVLCFVVAAIDAVRGLYHLGIRSYPFIIYPAFQPPFARPAFSC